MVKTNWNVADHRDREREMNVHKTRAQAIMKVSSHQHQCLVGGYMTRK